MVRGEVLNKALACVTQDRQETYGTPEDSFTAIARYWEVYLNNKFKGNLELEPMDVALMLALLKVARAQKSPKHADNFIDMAGYAACASEVVSGN